MACASWKGDDVVLNLKTQPRASKDELVEIKNDQLKVRIKAPPVDGKANLYLRAFLAKQFKVSKSAVELLRGDTSKNKQFLIHQPRMIPEILKTELRR